MLQIKSSQKNLRTSTKNFAGWNVHATACIRIDGGDSKRSHFNLLLRQIQQVMVYRVIMLLFCKVNYIVRVSKLVELSR